jgi:outer membrane murein-binding lipoprotein Lpp
MDKGVKFWGTLAAALLATVVLARGLAQSAAAEEIRPLENRVTRLETQRTEDREKLNEIAKDVKELLSRVPDRR